MAKAERCEALAIGPGARLLTIRGGGKSRVFDINRGSLALSGMTITGGRALRGGGIRNNDRMLWLTDVIVRGNSAREFGGGVFNAGTATLSDVVIQGNHARTGGNVANFGTLSLINVTIPGNSDRFGSGLSSSRAPTLHVGAPAARNLFGNSARKHAEPAHDSKEYSS
jgi:hypothetical protein